MRCPHCQHDNPDGAHLCGGCAAPVEPVTSCGACGTANPADRIRCFACDAVLRAETEAPVARRRIALPSTRVRFPDANEIVDADTLRRNYDKLRAAYEIAQGMTLERGLDGLLEQIVDTAIELLEADRAAILLLDRETGDPVMRVAKQRDEGRTDITLSRTILREVIDTKVGIISADAGVDQRFDAAASIRRANIRSAMCVPLLRGDEVLGVFHCDTLLTTGRFEEPDLELFTTIANEAAVAVENTMLLDRVREETKRRVQFQRFFSPGIVEQILSGGLDVGATGELRSIAVYFLDIRGFTRMAERMPATAVVDLLNEFFEAMVEVLFEHHGTLDKYVGDQLMALFGAPEPLPNAALAAVRCALAMSSRLDTFNERQVATKGPALDVGIGINVGDAVLGVVGSSKAGQYTAIGDTVNTAARLCEHAEGGQILIAEQTWDEVREHIRYEEFPPLLVKGKARPLRVFNVTGVS